MRCILKKKDAITRFTAVTDLNESVVVQLHHTT